jgi:hypothetical protein
VQRLADLAPLLGPACARDLVKVREDQALPSSATSSKTPPDPAFTATAV